MPESVTDDIEVVETKDKMDTFEINNWQQNSLGTVSLIHTPTLNCRRIIYADPHKSVDCDPVFSPELGLAIEKLPEGYSLQDLDGT